MPRRLSIPHDPTVAPSRGVVVGSADDCSVASLKGPEWTHDARAYRLAGRNKVEACRCAVGEAQLSCW